MKKKISVMLLVAALLMTGCGTFRMQRGSGNMMTETRAVNGFRAVRLATFGELKLVEGDIESLVVEAEDNIMPRIATRVSGGELFIEFEDSTGLFGRNPGSISPTRPVRYTLTAKTLDGIHLSGAGTISAEKIRSGDLMLRISGAGSMNLSKISADMLAITLSGAGWLQLDGVTKTQAVHMSGIGEYRGRNLIARDTFITISGAGSATINSSDSLDATISGAGNVRYAGNPRLRETITGAGRVRQE
jgi:hypothetical protein